MSNETINHLIHDRNVRGQTQTGWLDSFYIFSFSDFYDFSRLTAQLASKKQKVEP